MIKPLGNRIVIKPKLAETTTKSGIILPEDDSPKIEGRVIVSASPQVNKGDNVIYSQYGPVGLKIDNEEYVLAEEDHLLAIIEK